ncbi:unnamed protein product [Thelazia callipaeda]|uniref:G_PROTEIN_RECEP_F1_2 domain-containing protein n=1 Tax=Thelazia callipaeda TaxID=103827 RepID=A0A158RCZ0_THECL|nr:unnamed protein product [Thelazia callipaeda]
MNLLVLLLAIFPIIMTIGTVLGNILVLIAVVLSNGHPTRFLIANLAVADLFVGTIVMPLAVSNILTRSRWIYGLGLCKLWISLDVICSTASIVTLCAISCDRYIGVTRPLQYNVYVTRTRVLYTCFGIWLISVAILSATVRWTRSEVLDWKCNVAAELRLVFESTIGSFFIPLIIICFLYYRIFQVVNKGYCPSAKPASIQYKGKKRVRVTLLSWAQYREPEKERQCRRAFQKQRKTAKTLGIVVGAFILCWTPFFVLHSLSGLFETQLVPHYIMDIFTWLGYFNSMLNPFIYGTTMKSFRNSFRSIIVHINFCLLISNRFFNNRKEIKRSGLHISTKQYSTRIVTADSSLSEIHISNEHLSDKELAKALKLTPRSHADANFAQKLSNDLKVNKTNSDSITSLLNLKLYSMLVNFRSTDL